MRPLLYFTLLVFSFSLSCHLDKLPEQERCPTPPVASFSLSSTNCSAPCAISLTNNSVSATKYKWDFGDGTTATTASPAPHLYDKAGSYSISLIASNNGECADTVSQVVTITAGGPAPVADFTVDLSNNNGFAPCSVKFINSSADGTSFEWDFGDGSQKSTELSPIHSFKLGKSYLVSLKATNSFGENIKSKPVLIKITTFTLYVNGVPNYEPTGVDLLPNNTFIVAGTKSESSITNPFLIKLNNFGNISWEKSYPIGSICTTTNLQKESDFSFILTGISRSTQLSNSKFFMLKTNDSGIQQQFRIINENTTIEEYSSGVLPINQNQNYIFYGSRGLPQSGQILCYKTDTQGNFNSFSLYGDVSSVSYAASIDNLNEFLLLGRDNTNGYHLFMINNFTLQIEWEKILPGTNGIGAGDLFHDSDGNFLLCGSYSQGLQAMPYKNFIVKINNTGDILLDKRFSSTVTEYFNSIIKDNNGDFLISGTTKNNSNGESDIFLMKTNSLGETLWKHNYGTEITELGVEVKLAEDGGYIVLGGTQELIGNSYKYGLMIIKTDSDGNTQ